MLLYRTARGGDWGLGAYQQQHACLPDGPVEGHAKLGCPKSEPYQVVKEQQPSKMFLSFPVITTARP